MSRKPTEAQRRWNSFGMMPFNGFRVAPKPALSDVPPLETADLPEMPVIETEPSLPDGPSGELRFE